MFGVDDEGRQGATRFWVDGVAVTAGDGVPVEAELADIIRVADQVERGETDIDEVAGRRLFRATGSLGGARPKANVRIGAELWLAKFPKPVGDDWNVMAWEAAMLDAMREVGIDVPQHDGAGADWVDVVDFAQMAGADTTELWRRAVFGALVGNLDDHLRNHGFLRRGPAWVLAPAFDVNPEPLGDGSRHQLGLLGADDVEVDSYMAKEALSLFGVPSTAAHGFLERVRPVLVALPRYATAHGADTHSIEVMSSRIAAAVSALG